MMSGIIVSKDQCAVCFLIMIGIHHFLDRQSQVHQFTEEQKGRAIIEFHFPANKTTKSPRFSRFTSDDSTNGREGEQIQHRLEILLNQFSPH
jgi:hypothetical protein